MHTPWLYDKDSYTCPINPIINDQDETIIQLNEVNLHYITTFIN